MILTDSALTRAESEIALLKTKLNRAISALKIIENLSDDSGAKTLASEAISRSKPDPVVFECEWACHSLTLGKTIYPTAISLRPILETLVGKRTRVSIEVLDEI
jgi:hypothetical protein